VCPVNKIVGMKSLVPKRIHFYDYFHILTSGQFLLVHELGMEAEVLSRQGDDLQELEGDFLD
jgi:hypothetical protein